MELFMVLAKILNLLRFHSFINKPSRVLAGLKNHARSSIVQDIWKGSVLHPLFWCWIIFAKMVLAWSKILYFRNVTFKSYESQIGYSGRGFQIRYHFFDLSAHWWEISPIKKSRDVKLDFVFQLRSGFWSKFQIGYRCRGIRIRHHFYHSSYHWSEIRFIENSVAAELDFLFQLRSGFWSKFEIGNRGRGIRIRHHRYRAWGSESDSWIWVGASQ